MASYMTPKKEWLRSMASTLLAPFCYTRILDATFAAVQLGYRLGESPKVAYVLHGELAKGVGEDGIVEEAEGDASRGGVS